MSLTILDTPQDFQPVYSDGLFFTISADTTNKYKFRYVYDVYINDVLQFQGKSTPNPYSLGVIDISRIVKTYTTNMPISMWCTTPIFTHQTFPFSRPYTDETINYKVLFGYEYTNTPNGAVTGFTGNGNGVGVPSVDSGYYKTFYSTMGVNGRATQQDFNIEPFVLSGTPTGVYPTTSGLFLTNSPRIRDVRDEDYYALGFTNYYLNSGSMLSEPYYVEYKFYDDTGALLDTKQYQNLICNGGGPLPDCSAVYQSYYNIVSTANTEYNTLYVGAGPMNLQAIMPVDTAQYTVQLFGKFTGETTPIPPTPTPTPTPSSTPGCSECYIYDVYNPSLLLNANVSYIECSTGVNRVIAIPPNSFVQIDCACANSLIYETALVVTIVDACFGTTPTPTPSASASTPTPTPTPSSTPSTPTPTPTPSSTPECNGFVVNECFSTCVTDNCFCDSATPTTIYLDPLSTPSDLGANVYADCERTILWFGDYEYGGIIYNASPITTVCLVGGGC